MGQINTLINEHLVPECYCEREMFSGDMPRQFFIEIFNSCDKSTLDEMLEQYNPTSHNSEWESEHAKWNSPGSAPDPDKIMTPRRAIAFMYAGRMGIHKHYKETELRAHVTGRARMNRNLNFLRQTADYFAYPNMEKKTYKPG